jgi:hypothetical protein
MTYSLLPLILKDLRRTWATFGCLSKASLKVAEEPLGYSTVASQHPRFCGQALQDETASSQRRSSVVDEPALLKVCTMALQPRHRVSDEIHRIVRSESISGSQRRIEARESLIEISELI